MKAPRARITLTVMTALLMLAAGSATAQYSFDWTLPQQGAVKELFEFHDFMTDFTNTSALTDSFRITLVKDMPVTWQATLCEGPTCYPPNYTVHTFELGPSESTNLDFAITAALDEGRGTSTVTVESLNDPGVTATNSFTIVTAGLEILTVDADGGMDYETYYMDAIGAAGRTTADWTRSYMGALTPADMANFTGVVWVAGSNSTSLDAADFAALDDFVYNDGNLFISGQNLANDYCNPAGVSYTPEAQAWFQDVLGADFLGEDAGTSTVDGVVDDLVGNGFSFAINGGDGANNNDSPDEVTALSNGAISLIYSTGTTAGIRGAYNDGRTYYTSFGFEGVTPAATRGSLMTAILDWITNPFTAVGGDVIAPVISRPYVTPNPFNPQTSLKFEVGGSQAVNSEVVIYDLRGHAVRNLFQGVLEPGLRTMVWNGRDNGGRSLASGIYMAQVKVADETRTVKMTLAR